MTPRGSRRLADASSHLQIYLQDINNTPLLTQQEERDLAGRISRGDPEAREHMVRANLRLVVNIARGYLGKGLSLDDLIMEGNLGLMRAVEGFDGTMENRFSTYASYWIKQSIRRGVMNQGKPIRLPAYMVTLLAKWKRVTALLSEQHGRPPTPEEVAKELRLSKRKLGIVNKAIQINNLSPHPEGPDDEGNILDDVLTDDNSKAPDVAMSDADELSRTMLRLARLDEREASVLRLRFGLDDDGPLTLREIGERLGLTRERVRQLETHALAKLAMEVGGTNKD